MAHAKFTLTQQQRDIASIADTPPDVLPDGIPALLLYGLAHCGYGIRCYQSGGPSGVWCVWIDRLNRRIPLAEWIAGYPAILRELGYRTDGTAEEEGSADA